MLNKIRRKHYATLFFVGIITLVAGFSIYYRYKDGSNILPEKVYRELTKTEEQIVKQNIKNLSDNQKSESINSLNLENDINTQDTDNISDNKTPETTDDIVSDILTELPELSDKENVTIRELDKKPDLKAMRDQFLSNNLPNGLPQDDNSIHITSADQLRNTINKLESLNNPNLTGIINALKSVDTNGDINMTFSSPHLPNQ